MGSMCTRPSRGPAATSPRMQRPWLGTVFPQHTYMERVDPGTGTLRKQPTFSALPHSAGLAADHGNLCAEHTGCRRNNKRGKTLLKFPHRSTFDFAWKPLEIKTPPSPTQHSENSHREVRLTLHEKPVEIKTLPSATRSLPPAPIQGVSVAEGDSFTIAEWGRPSSIYKPV